MIPTVAVPSDELNPRQVVSEQVGSRSLAWPVCVTGGLALGSALALGILFLPLGPPALVVALAVLGAVTGHALHRHRRDRVQADAALGAREAALTDTRADAEARREILELARRQHEWVLRVEEGATRSLDELDPMAGGVESQRMRHSRSVRSFAHDLRSPLTVLKTNVSFLRDSGSCRDEEGAEVLADIDFAIGQMERRLDAFAADSVHDPGTAWLVPETLEVADLAGRIRLRLEALVRGRRVTTTVERSREAPPAIEIDRLLLDRVLDNLLLHAARATEQGSITVELDGTPGRLTVKVCDTSRGIEEAQLARVLSSRASRPGVDAEPDWAAGLLVVVELLARAGGKLDVTSKPGVGTTFWAHLPVHARPSLAPPRSSGERRRLQSADTSQVVSIRRPLSA